MSTISSITGSQVAIVSADDLFSGVQDLAAAATAPGIGRAERMARLSRAAERARDLHDAAGMLDPYLNREHSRIADMLALAGVRHVQADPAEAAERLALAAQHDKLQGLMRSQTRAIDFAGLKGKGIVPTGPAAVSAANWLNGYAIAPTKPVGPADELPTQWSAIPEAVINPGAGNPVNTGAPVVLNGEPVLWQSAAWGANESLQSIDWTSEAGREYEALVRVIVDHGLETLLLAQLTTGAPTAASLEAAEIAVGAAWAGGADLLLVNAADKPKVVRLYSTAGVPPEDRPRIMPTAGVAAGSAIMLAQSTVHLSATGLEWMIWSDPHHLGKIAAGIRYGRVRSRIAGAIQKLVIA